MITDDVLDVIMDAAQRYADRRVARVEKEVLELRDDKRIMNDTIVDLQNKLADANNRALAACTVRVPSGIVGTQLIAEERASQWESKGYSSEHDDKHDQREMAEEALALLDAYVNQGASHYIDRWGTVKKTEHDTVKLLTVAGALVAAEIDRVLRKVKNEF